MKIQIKQHFLDIFHDLKATLDTDELYLVGGFVRDSILGLETTDMDLATPLAPRIVASHFPDALVYARFGTVSFKVQGVHVTIASFRKETGYIDYRHPQKVTFIEDMTEDSKRRDFTINALYLKENGEILDPTGFGINDIFSKRLRVIGEGGTRFVEDPLRLIRAYRFKEELGLSFDEETERAIMATKGLISLLNPDKIRMEIAKAPKNICEKLINDLKALGFDYNK